VAGDVHLFVDGKSWFGSAVRPVVSGAEAELQVGRSTGDAVGLHGCLDEVFLFSTVVSRSELVYLGEFWFQTHTPTVGGAGYGLRFVRSRVSGTDGTPLLRGGSVEIAGDGGALVLSPLDAPSDAMTLSVWTLPDDPASLVAAMDAGVSVPQFVLVDKSSAASTPQPACPGVEYRVSLEATTDRSGSTAAMHYELRVDIGVQTLSDGTLAGGHQWQTGVVVPHGVWTFITVSWDSTSVSVLVNGLPAVRHRCVDSLQCGVVCSRL
jgi:hypothetical protein